MESFESIWPKRGMDSIESKTANGEWIQLNPKQLTGIGVALRAGSSSYDDGGGGGRLAKKGV